MDITRKIAVVAVTALALGGTGAATAFASSHGQARAHQVSAEPARPDTDSLQVGNGEQGNGEQGEQGNGEQGNDGPGGHADPSGNADHQFDGVE